MNEKVDLMPVFGRLLGNARTMAGLSGDPVMRANVRDGEAAGLALCELIEAASNASAILGHAYHTQIRGELEQDAHDAYQRLDAALANAGCAK